MQAREAKDTAASEKATALDGAVKSVQTDVGALKTAQEANKNDIGAVKTSVDAVKVDVEALKAAPAKK